MKAHALIFIMLAALLVPPFASLADEARVVVVGGSPKAVSSASRQNKGTRVISLKGAKHSAAKAGDDICPSVGGRFYCAHVGSTAVESATGEDLGEIIGVAWKEEGEAITRYLPSGWLAMPADQDVLGINVPAGAEGFYYIIRAEGRITFMVECGRISPGR